MNPLTELIKAFTKPSATSGTIISLSKMQAVVSTAKGSQTCILAINTPLQVGDKVSLYQQQVVAKLTPDEDVPNFVV